MVRLMHSMVRVNVLSRPGMWDADTYGMPIPQLDQMPAGLIPVYFMSQEVLAKGRTRFTRLERGRSEEHTSELQSLMRISYAVFCLKKKKQDKNQTPSTN